MNEILLVHQKHWIFSKRRGCIHFDKRDLFKFNFYTHSKNTYDRSGDICPSSFAAVSLGASTVTGLTGDGLAIRAIGLTWDISWAAAHSRCRRLLSSQASLQLQLASCMGVLHGVAQGLPGCVSILSFILTFMLDFQKL